MWYNVSNFHRQCLSVCLTCKDIIRMSKVEKVSRRNVVLKMYIENRYDLMLCCLLSAYILLWNKP